jgi:hypothetical protein
LTVVAGSNWRFSLRTATEVQTQLGRGVHGGNRPFPPCERAER